MYITKLVVENFKCLRATTIELNPYLNIIVGDNEAGKSTLLEAINLVLTRQINGRDIQSELTPYLFNETAVLEYITALKAGVYSPPPKIKIEAYFVKEPGFDKFRGENNSLREDCPGISLAIEFDEDNTGDFSDYIRSAEQMSVLPTEYYVVLWQAFSGNSVNSRSVPLDATFIDTSLLRVNSGAGKYISKIIDGVLEPRQRIELALEYRKMRNVFLEQEGVKAINSKLATKKGDITDKELSVSMDVSSRSAWESNITTHLNNIPLVQAGKGEQTSVNLKLAMETSCDAHVLLIEEPENHLSYPNMSKLIKKIADKCKNKQIVIATHSSFVLNKLDIGSVILFNHSNWMKLTRLKKETIDYFMKLPGHDTLRLILSKKAILVEGPSDELIVQKAYMKKHKVSPLEGGVDIICVKSLAFKRFLEIADILGLTVRVVTDNDGSVRQLEEKYKEYLSHSNIKICYDRDEQFRTLEPQLLKANSLELLNRVLGKTYISQEELMIYMMNNKTESALSIFNSDIDINFPQYIQDAIN